MTSTLKYLILLSFLFTTSAISQATRQLDAHNHGNAQLNIVIYESQISFSLESPAANMVGFEHVPKNEEQQAQFDRVKETLGDYTNLFKLSADADCQSTESSVHWSLDIEEEHNETEEHEEHDSGHSEFEVDFLLTCQNIKNLIAIDVRLFERFPVLETINVEALFENAQLVDVLTPGDSTIEIAQ